MTLLTKRLKSFTNIRSSFINNKNKNNNNKTNNTSKPNNTNNNQKNDSPKHSKQMNQPNESSSFSSSSSSSSCCKLSNESKPKSQSNTITPSSCPSSSSTSLTQTMEYESPSYSSSSVPASDLSFAQHSPAQSQDYETQMDEGHNALIDAVCTVLLNMMQSYVNDSQITDLPPGSPPNKGSMSPKTRWKEVMLSLVRPSNSMWELEQRRVMKDLRHLIDDLQLYSDAAPPCMVLALMYLDQIVSQNRVFLSVTDDLGSPTMSSAMMDFVRYFAVCLALASKVYEDRYLSNADWVWVYSEVVDISLRDFSRIETQVLLDLQFCLVRPFPQMIASLEKWFGNVPELLNGETDHFTTVQWYISTFHSDYEQL